MTMCISGKWSRFSTRWFHSNNSIKKQTSSVSFYNHVERINRFMLLGSVKYITRTLQILDMNLINSGSGNLAQLNKKICSNILKSIYYFPSRRSNIDNTCFVILSLLFLFEEACKNRLNLPFLEVIFYYA